MQHFSFSIEPYHIYENMSVLNHTLLYHIKINTEVKGKSVGNLLTNQLKMIMLSKAYFVWRLKLFPTMTKISRKQAV